MASLMLTKHPDVAHSREPTEVDRFWSHPLNRKLHGLRSWNGYTQHFRSYHDIHAHSKHLGTFEYI